jgi:hypothetical protein
MILVAMGRCGRRRLHAHPRYPDRVRSRLPPLIVLASLTWSACDETPASPSRTTVTTLRVVFLGSTTRRADLPASAQACVTGVGVTHIHPSWRSFETIPLQAVPPDRYEMTFTDVPAGSRVSFRINDQNFCDENPTGAVTRNVVANDVRLAQNAITPGSGDEPGYALAVAANGAVTQ